MSEEAKYAGITNTDTAGFVLYVNDEKITCGIYMITLGLRRVLF